MGALVQGADLLQQYEGRLAYLWSVDQMGGTGYAAGSTVLMSYGGNPDLKPERARTWTTSLVFHPEALPGLNAELSYFNIDYTDRVVQPLLYRANTLSDPAYAQFVMYAPTAKQQPGTARRIRRQFLQLCRRGLRPDKVVAIAHDEYINVGKQRVKGVDLSGSYHLGPWRWRAGADRIGELDRELAEKTARVRRQSTWPARFTNPPNSAVASVRYGTLADSRLRPTPTTPRRDQPIDGDARKNGLVHHFRRHVAIRNATGQHGAFRYHDIAVDPEPVQQAAAAVHASIYRLRAVRLDHYSAIGRYTSVSVAKHF